MNNKSSNQKSIWGQGPSQFFYDLSPDIILDAVDQLGFRTTGRILTLNSMENRVYEIEIENENKAEKNISPQFIVAKFYRPGRWSKEQILEEHAFLLDLKELEIPVIAPLLINDQTLFFLEKLNLHFCLFPKQGGRAPSELTNEDLEQLGRLLARVHNVGEGKKAIHRLSITPETYLSAGRDYLLENKIIPSAFESPYLETVDAIYAIIKDSFLPFKNIRLHGDCHLGNIIHRDTEGQSNFYLIDFDDMAIGPAAQDIWQLFFGRHVDEEIILQRQHFFDGYTSMRDFDFRELSLIEPLRTLRMINYTVWIAKRYQDPAFQHHFPHFSSSNYWGEHISDLKDQLFHLSQSNQYSNLNQAYEY